MKKITIQTSSYDETENFGKQFASDLIPGDVILLNGDLGVGKTTFTRGIASGLGITKNVKSPTFTLIREYKGGRIPLYHMDMYRLEDSMDEDLGFSEYFDGDGVSIVEWPQFIKDELPKDHISISIRRNLESEDGRIIEIILRGDKYQARSFGGIK
ncbi:tRNA (adenosine(37)-N6)-threonylcarbamoyltransferase complex ATPase subunit type 1 TsaE [Companilactobacillus metriopterae]|uniref:tRNA (adenosine(37)-N6)-threonylcarbamoyltransferase complex ATPase subunit type 1 TsaE n=1 Tax=Companilactobacillus metriopterae TaxID=1909267 RepID=UPI00100C079C|nr:tRNA (adenosine(37)-N6)-threonylcarbamoyltransferase complex ATPase subunit type 1 TsaE [Companilactobacillus metriopterae]